MTSCLQGTEVVREGSSLASEKLSFGPIGDFGQVQKVASHPWRTEVVRKGNSLALKKLSLGTTVAFGLNLRSDLMSQGDRGCQRG